MPAPPTRVKRREDPFGGILAQHARMTRATEAPPAQESAAVEPEPTATTAQYWDVGPSGREHFEQSRCMDCGQAMAACICADLEPLALCDGCGRPITTGWFARGESAALTARTLLLCGPCDRLAERGELSRMEE